MTCHAELVEAHAVRIRIMYIIQKERCHAEPVEARAREIRIII